MKNTFTFCFIAFSLSSFFAQQQIGNSNMEEWDNIGAATEEPTNWNGFKTASGQWAPAGSQQVFRSTAIRSGASGMYCARIFSKLISIVNVVANGTLTLGRINMGSTTVTDISANYNISLTNDPNFSEALTSIPDSIVFWAKYTAAENQEARIHAIIHDSFDVHDPFDAASMSHVSATAEYNFSPNTAWVRYSVAFDPSAGIGIPPPPAFILVTFATNAIAGGGAANDEVLIDDIQLIYNSVGINETNTNISSANYTVDNGLIISGLDPFYTIFNLSGQQIKSGLAIELNGLKLNSGIYIVKSSNRTQKIFVP